MITSTKPSQRVKEKINYAPYLFSRAQVALMEIMDELWEKIAPPVLPSERIEEIAERLRGEAKFTDYQESLTAATISYLNERAILFHGLGSASITHKKSEEPLWRKAHLLDLERVLAVSTDNCDNAHLVLDFVKSQIPE